MPQTIHGHFEVGVELEGKLHMDFELREMSTGDMLDAECEVPMTQTFAFRTAVAAYQLLRIGSYEGPFNLQLMRRIHPRDINIIHQKQTELEALGEAARQSRKTP